MRPSWLLLALIGCDSGSPSPYGNKPHIMGRAGAITVHDTADQVRQNFFQLDAFDGVAQFHDGATDYRVFFSERGRVEDVLVYQTGKRADVEAAWGRGTPGVVGGSPATYYFDAGAATCYVVFDGQPGQFVVAAHDYWPLSRIWDDGHDIRMFGLDLLGKPLADDVAALAAIGVDSVTDANGTRYDNHLMSDAGTVRWSLESTPNGRVTKLEMQIGPYEVPSNSAAMDALFVEKWGKPTMGREMRFPVEPHQIVEYHDKDIWITE